MGSSGGKNSYGHPKYKVLMMKITYFDCNDSAQATPASLDPIPTP